MDVLMAETAEERERKMNEAHAQPQFLKIRTARVAANDIWSDLRVVNIPDFVAMKASYK